MNFWLGVKQDMSKEKHAYTRSTGSQVEIPSAQTFGGAMVVSGYHNYTISKNGDILIPSKLLKQKIELMRPVLERLPSDLNCCDIGCSGGAVGLSVNKINNRNICFLDHDSEYITLIEQVLDYTGIQGCTVEVSSVANSNSHCSIGVALALIHWIYSYSEETGSLNKAIQILKNIAQDHLFIEWVSEDDAAIKKANHLKQNIHVQKDKYNRKNFQLALKGHYQFATKIANVSPTREIWFASNNFEIYNDLRIKIFLNNLKVFLKYKCTILYLKIYTKFLLKKFSK